MLLVRRSSWVHEPGTWGIPGGKIDPGEDAWQAARREVIEELGAPPPGPRAVMDRVVVRLSPDFAYTTFFVHVEDCEGWRPRLNDEHTSWGWFTRRQAARLELHPGLESLLEF